MVVAPLAIDLFVILACLGAIIIIVCTKAIVTALFEVGKTALGWVPWLGGKVKSSLDKHEQRMISAMSDQVNGLQGVVGAFWHALGNLLSSIGHEIAGLAQGVGQLADYMHGVVRPWVVRTVLHWLQHGVKWIRHELTSTKTQVYRITRVIEHPSLSKIGGAIKAALRGVEAEIATWRHWTQLHVKALAHTIDVVIPRDITGLRSRTKALERLYDRLWKHVRKLDRLTAASAITAAVALAITRLGFGWVRCSNWRKVGRGVCRVNPSLIDELLLGTLAVVGTISMKELIEELQGEMELAMKGINALIRK